MVKVRNLSDEERMAVYHELLQKSTRGKLEYGNLGTVPNKFGVHYRTVSRLWNRTQASETYLGTVKKKGLVVVEKMWMKLTLH